MYYNLKEANIFHSTSLFRLVELGRHLNKKLLPQSSQFHYSRVFWLGARLSRSRALQTLTQVFNDGFNTYGIVQ